MGKIDTSFVAAMVGVAAAFAIVLSAGFLIDRYFPTVTGNVLGAVLACVLVAVAFGVHYLLTPRQPKPKRTVAVIAAEQRRKEMKKDAEQAGIDFREAKRLRIAELSADPARRPYAGLMERGGWWTDEQIAYNEDANRTATCAHLQPVERAMRSDGIVPLLLTEAWPDLSALSKVRADCRIDEAQLRRRFPHADSVRHVTGFYPERAANDNPWAQLACVTCPSSIELVHPEYPRPGTRWFPVALEGER